MKKLLQFSLLCVLSMLLIYSCAKNEETDLSDSTDELQLMIIQHDAEPALPDLVITSMTSTLPITNGPCPGGTMSNATCGGPFGQVDFTFSAVVKNITNVAVPAGVPITVDFCIAGGACITFTSFAGLAGGASLTATSVLSSIACPTGAPPYQLIQKTFYSEVDQNNNITEFRENNNFSQRFFICCEQD